MKEKSKLKTNIGRGTAKTQKAGNARLKQPMKPTAHKRSAHIARRKKDETVLERRTNELSALQKTVLDITKRRSLPDLLNLIVERAAKLLHATSGGMYLAEPEKRIVRCVVSYNTQLDFRGTVLAYGEGAAGLVAETGQPLMIEDYSKWSGRAKVYEDKQPFQAVISAPMVWHGQVSGVIHVLRENKFTQEELDLLDLFANHAAVAVENANLYNAVQQELAERRRAEDALRESEEKFKTLFNFANDAIFTMNHATFLDCNVTTEKIFGCSRDQIIGHSPVEFSPELQPDGRLSSQSAVEKIEAAFAGEPQFFEWVHTHSDGTPFDAEVSLNRVFIGGGFVLQAIVRDITERKQAEEKIRESEERLAALMEGSQLGYSDWNIQTGEIRRNERWANMLGYTLHEIETTYDQWEELIHPDDRARAEQAVQDHLDGKTPIHRDEYRLRTKDGSYRWILDQGKIIEYDEQSHPLRMTASHTDITERKLAEEALRKSEQRLQAFFNQSLDGFFFTNFDEPREWKNAKNKEEELEYIITTQRFTDVNDAMLKQYNISREKFLSLTTKDIFAYDLEQGRNLRRELFDKGHLRLETFERTSDGTPVWFEGDYVCLYDEAERITGFFGIQRDITDRKHAETLQDAVYRIANAAVTTESLNDLFSQIHQIISSVMPAENFYITLYDEERNVLQFPYFMDALDEPYLGEIQPGLGLTAYVLRKGVSLLCTQAVHDELERQGEVKLLGVPSAIWLGVPLIIEGKTIGAMVVQHYSDPEAYGEREQHMLEFVSSQVAIAINRKRAEDALKRSESFTKSIIENEPECVKIISAGGILQYMNPAGLAMIEVDDLESVVGKSVYFMVAEEHREAFVELTEKVLRGEQGTLQFEAVGLKGTRIWLDTHAVPLFDEQGKVTALLGLTRDITEHKRAEEAARAAEEKYHSIFENAVEGIYQSSPEGRFITVNPALARMLGFESPQEMIASITDIASQVYGESSRRTDFMKGLEEEGSVSGFEYQMRRKDNNMIWVSENARVVRNAEGRVHYYEGIVEDITARKNAENALLESEWRNRVVAEMTTDYTFIVDVEQGGTLKLRWASENMVRITGRTANEAASSDMWKNIIHPDDLGVFYDFINKLLDSGEADVIECRTFTGSGVKRWVEINAQPLKDDNGMITSIVGAIKDVSERKRAEESLRESEERFHSLFDNATIGMYRTAPHGAILLSNPAGTRMLGYDSFEDLSRRNLEEEGYETDYSRDKFREIMQSKGTVIGLESAWKRKDGSTIYVRESATAVKDRDGNILYYDGTFEDITARKQAEEQLLLQSAALNAAANAIMISDRDGNIEWVNPAYSIITGYKIEEVIGKNPRFIKSGVHTDAFYKNLWDTVLSGQVWRSEVVNKRKDGTLFTVDETITPILDANNQPNHFIGITQDITARKQSEQRIQNQIKRLNALHDIDNAIKSNADLRITLEVLLEQVTAQLNVDAASVLLFNKNTLTLEYTASRGFRSTATQHTKLEPGEGYAGRVIMERRIIHIPDLTKKDGKLVEALSLAGENFTAYVGVPLLAKGQIVGVLEIFQRLPLTPDREWFDYLETLAGQAAIAIDNAQLFENLQRSNFELTLSYDATIEGWSRAMELRDEETEGHTQRVTTLTLELARQMGVPETELIHIRRGALLHDIGKMGIPDSILHKPDTLTDEEQTIMRRHPTYAYEMLTPIPYLRPALDIPYSHHERWDGTGYPQGLKGGQIPLPARIFAIVDVWDALTSNRPYRPAWTKEKAIEHIREQSGKHFDPKVTTAFLQKVVDNDI